MRAPGFTLIELTVAIAITGLVALLVYGTARAAYDTAERIEASRHGVQSVRAMRMLLSDALRGARAVRQPSDTVFALEARLGPGGRPADRLWFATQGGFPPLEPEADWTITLRASAEGLRLSARPKGLRQRSSIEAVLPGITGLEVDVLAGSDWTRAWPAVQAAPSAVRLTYWSDSGPVGLPLLVALDPEARR